MKIVFMGTPQAAVPSLERCMSDGHDVAAVYTQPDRASGRGNKIRFSPVKEFAIDHGLPVFQPLKIKNAETLEIFRSHKADAAIVVAYGRVLPESYLSAFRLGAINVHFSLLPKYRGAAPVNWAIVNGETQTGVTTMRMDVGLDTGDTLLQRSTSIGETETSVVLMTRLGRMGADLLSETLGRLTDIEPVPQDHAQATLAPIMKREDGVISWTMNAADIANRVRGFQPFPTAYTSFRGGKLILWDTQAVSVTAPRNSQPGEIIRVGPDELVIACGDGSMLAVTELQTEGKRRMPVRDFINGFRPVPGDLLGS